MSKGHSDPQRGIKSSDIAILFPKKKEPQLHAYEIVFEVSLSTLASVIAIIFVPIQQWQWHHISHIDSSNQQH